MKKILATALLLAVAVSARSQCQNSGFSGLNTEYSCPSSTFLTGSPAGGIFGGPGVSNDEFDPLMAGLGTHVITYTVPASSPTAGYGVEEGLTNNPYAGAFTSVTLSDDQTTAGLPIGFTFNFFGTDYTQFVISSNGFISFDPLAGNGCCSGQTLPEALDPNNLIALAWNDLNPGGGGTIGYTTIGSAPNRILIVNYSNVPHFGGSGTPVTVQAKLYESTNVIEIHSTSNVTDGTEQTLGVENAPGTCGVTAMGTNANTTFSVNNEMIRFTPQAAQYYSHMTGLTNAPYSGSMTSVSLTNDALSGVLPIGFSFDFYGTNYTDFRISSNGYITFDQATSNSGCCAGASIPAAATPNGLIAFAWNDLNPAAGGTVSYTTIGTAPNRILIVDFNGVPQVSGGTPVTAQVKIYETSNVIEVHSTQNTANGTAQTMGLENATGSEGISPFGRNASTTFSVNNEMTVFHPYYTSIQTTNVISLTDVEPPVPFNLVLPDITAECSVDFIEDQFAEDNCSGFIQATHDAVLPITSNSVVTFTYDDGNGNVLTQTQNVLIQDVTAPVVAAFEIHIIVGAAWMDEVSWTFTDNGGNVVASGGPYGSGMTGEVIATVQADGINGPYTFSGESQGPIGDNVLNYEIFCSGTLVASGTTGVNSTASSIGIATCNPLQDVVSECGPVFSLDPVTADDNCSGTINGVSDAVFPITSDAIVTWTFDDGNGNVSTYTQNVLFPGDQTAPTPDAAQLPDVVSYCTPVNNLTVPTATDNCGATVMGFTTTLLPITTTSVVTWSYNDGQGNISTQTQNVVIEAPIPTISLNGTTLSVDNPIANSAYQWLDCDNGNTPITGATASSYTPTVTGSYAVQVTVGGCVNTSTCELVDFTGINEWEIVLFSVYPNPTAGEVKIFASAAGTIELIDLFGKIISVTPVHGGENELNCTGLANGTYTLRFISENGARTSRLVINRQ